MELQFFGANAVRLSGKDLNLLVDPFLYGSKLPSSVFKNSPVVLLTQKWDGLVIDDGAFVIDTPGEYEVSGLNIKAIAAQLHVDKPDDAKQSVIYRVTRGEYSFGFIGNIYGKLSDEQLESLGLVDVLVIPVGGNGYTLDAVASSQLVRDIEPKLVVPSHYLQKDINFPVVQNNVDKFTAELGWMVEKLDKVKLKGGLSDTPTVAVVNS